MTVQGEPDTKSFTRIFDYQLSDEKIFQESVQLIKKRLSNNMKLNINEVRLNYLEHLSKLPLMKKNQSMQIQKYIPKLLSANQVLIGVPESLRQLTFRIMTDGGE